MQSWEEYQHTKKENFDAGWFGIQSEKEEVTYLYIRSYTLFMQLFSECIFVLLVSLFQQPKVLGPGWEA